MSCPHDCTAGAAVDEQVVNPRLLKISSALPSIKESARGSYGTD